MRLAALLLLAACTTTPPEDPVTTETEGSEIISEPPDPAETGAEPALELEVRAADAEAAVGALRARLRERVLGPWGREAPVTLLGADAITVDTIDGQTRAHLALDDAELRAVLEGLPAVMPRPTFGEAFAERVAPLQEAAIANFVCERRRALFEDAECELADLEESVRLAAEALRPLRLEPLWSGGVPVGAQGQPLRKPAVQLRLGDEPARGLVGLPILVMPAGEGAPLRVATDDEGLALLNVEPGDGLVATLDRAALMPPLDAIFPELRAPLRPRPVSLRRWTLVGADGPFAEALGEALAERGAEPPLALDRSTSRALQRASRRAGTLRALANEQGGALDVVLAATVESHFASRMGSRRTWYEAEAEVQAFLAWTGESLGRFEARGNANGIGDERAEAAAREKVARDLARQLAAAPALGLTLERTAALAGAVVAAF